MSKMKINQVEFEFDPTDYLKVKAVEEAQETMLLEVEEAQKVEYPAKWMEYKAYIDIIKGFFVHLTGADVIGDCSSYDKVLGFVAEFTETIVAARKETIAKYSVKRVR